MQRFLVAIDGSATALRAVESAADLARQCEAELIVTAVAPPPSAEIDRDLAAYARLEHIAAPSAEFAAAALNAVLDESRDLAQRKGVSRLSTEPRFGDPADQILAAARDRQADLIAIGARGHGRLAGLLLGSVSQKVVSLSACPILVVR
jgi:nucleotide-binding universal stress UspA family protein